jgi:hypothetical protein
MEEPNKGATKTIYAHGRAEMMGLINKHLFLQESVETTGYRENERHIIQPYEFGDYTVNVVLTERGEFVGINDISEKHRDFLTMKQKMGLTSTGSLAEDLYRE